MKPVIMNFRDFMDQMVEVAEGRQAAPNFHGKRVFASPAAREHFMRRQALTDIARYIRRCDCFPVPITI